MKRIAGKAKYALIILLAACMAFSACALETETKKPVTPRTHGSFIDEDTIKQAVSRAPLSVVKRNFTQSGSVVTYPYIASADMDLLNLSIHSAFSEFAKKCAVEDSYITFSVEFNKLGLLSILMTLTGPSGFVLCTDTANFNCDTGYRVYLDDCFGSSYTDYTSGLRGTVEEYVEKNGLTLIGEIPPIKDDSPFLFTNDGICLVYGEYELCTFEGGSPRIPVPLSKVKDLVASNGLLNRYMQ